MTAAPLIDSVPAHDRRDLHAAWRAALARARRLEQPLALVLLGVRDASDVQDSPGVQDALGARDAPGSAGPGDGARRRLARLLQARLRPGDRVVRFGREAFVLLLAGIDARGALPVMRRLQRELASEMGLSEQVPAPLTLWAGVTGLAGGDEPAGGDELAGALARAHAALRQAMRAGDGRVAAG